MALDAVAAFALARPFDLVGQQPGDIGHPAHRIELIREVTIGQSPTEPEYEFASIGSAAVVSSGTVFLSVSDGSVVRIRKYDPSGRYRGTVGRPGSGPGEYRGVSGMAVVGDTLLVVFDRGNGRVVLFDTAGAYLRSFPVAGGSVPSPKQFAVSSDGLVSVRARTQEVPSGAGLVTSVFVRHNLYGEVLDSVPVPAEQVSPLTLVLRNLGSRVPFTVTAVFALLPRGGIATAHNNTTYRVAVAPARGSPFSIDRRAQAIHLDGLERREWEAMLRQAGRAARGAALPRQKPIIRDLLADPEGRIWVELYTEATRRVRQSHRGESQLLPLTMWEHNAYDVFDDRGQYLGRVDLPLFSRLLAVQGDRAWVAEETDSGWYALVRYRLGVSAGR